MNASADTYDHGVETQEVAARMILLLMLDVSKSMKIDDRIGHFEAELNRWLTETKKNRGLRGSLYIGLLTFGNGGVRLLNLQSGGEAQSPADGFTALEHVTIPELTAAGVTPMIAAIHSGLDALRSYKDYLKGQDKFYYRPFQLLVTDGYPTDEDGNLSEAGVDEARQRLVITQNAKGVLFRAIGVQGANVEILARLAGDIKDEQSTVSTVEGFDWASVLAMMTDSVTEAMRGPGAAAHERDPSTVRSDQLEPHLAHEQKSLRDRLEEGHRIRMGEDLL